MITTHQLDYVVASISLMLFYRYFTIIFLFVVVFGAVVNVVKATQKINYFFLIQKLIEFQNSFV